MSFQVIIPARLASTRLPNKPLVDIAGVPMVVRVARQAQRSAATGVFVAADHPQIVEVCHDHGVQALLTRQDHPSGSDRLAEACGQLGLGDDEVVVNVQGDEPLIAPELIDACAQALRADTACVMSTAAHPLHQLDEWLNPNTVKVVVNAQGHALYFSRSPLPAWRDRLPNQDLSQAPAPILRHVGIYAYRAAFLRGFPKLGACPLEHAEMLEQLRVLWHGFAMAVHVTDQAPAPGVDTPEDLERVGQVLQSRP